ncbi:MAG: DUF4386 family protein, partial [Hyphomonadaceae bacterium]
MTAAPNTAAKTAAGILLIAVPLVFTAGFTGLQMTFDYPDILRHPAGEVLTRFAAAGWDLHAYWYAMMAAALGMIPASILTALHFWKRDNVLAAMSAAFGVLAGLVQALGLIRWVVLVPGLASAYVTPGATDLDKAMAASIFDATNLYLGVGVGEHLGYLFTGVWTLIVAALIFPAHRILSVTGAVLSLTVMAGMLEPFGVPGAATINAIGFSLWALWALLLGVALIMGRNAAVVATPQMA